MEQVNQQRPELSTGSPMPDQRDETANPPSLSGQAETDSLTDHDKSDGKVEIQVTPVPGFWHVPFRDQVLWFKDATLADQMQYRGHIARSSIDLGLDVAQLIISDTGLYSAVLARAFCETLLDEKCSKVFDFDQFKIDDWEELGSVILSRRNELDAEKKN